MTQDIQADRDATIASPKVLLVLSRFLLPYRWQLVAAMVALIFTAGVVLSLGQGFRILVDRGFSGSLESLNESILIFMLIVLLMAIGTFVRFFLVSWIGERVCADIRMAVFNHVVELHPSFFETNTSGEIQSRITTDTTLLQTVIGSSASIAVRNLLTFFGGVIWLFITNPKLTAIVLVSVPFVLFPIIYFGRRVRKLAKSSQEKVADAGSFVGEALQNIKIVQAFNHQQDDQKQFSGIAEAAFAVAVKRITQRSWLSTVVIFLVLGAVAGMLWIGGHDVLMGKISPGELAAFVFYALIVAAALGAFSEVLGDLQRAAGATERLIELMATENLIVAPTNPQSLPQSVSGHIVIDKLHFSYPSRPDNPALSGLTLDVPAAKSLALVGVSGAGKSTLFDLILRFYDPQQGAIYFDDTDISQLDPLQLRQHLAIVPQSPMLFSGTIRDNIRYGKPGASEQEVKAAATAAFASDFIDKLPEGYDSHLGEFGARLSGGQRQRIAIARALLKDPAVLLLDEATSALDAESEFIVQQALNRLMQHRTTIVIAHRLATVVNVDSIAVLDQGRLVAQGTHHELLQSSDLYARWAQLQFDKGSLLTREAV